MSPPNQTGRGKSQGASWDDLHDSFFDKSDIMGFFEEMERRQMESAPLHRLDHLLGQFGPSILFTLVMDTLHEMGDLDNVLDIVEPMAHEYQRARRMLEVHERRSRRDPFFGIDYGREESAIARGHHEVSGTFVIDDIDFSTIDMMRNPNLNAMDYRDSDIFQDQIRRKRTRPK